MSDKFVVKAEVRDERGKNEIGRLRRSGSVPMVVYGSGGEAVAVKAELRDVAAVLRSEHGANTVFTLDIAGKETCDVVFQDRQIDPLKGRLKHADLRRIESGQPIELNVTVQVEGENEHVKNQGGNVNIVLHELHVRCQPNNIPDAIHVDLATLGEKDVLHVSDIKAGSGVEILNAPDQVVVSVSYISAKQLEESLVSQVDTDAVPAETSKENEGKE